MATRADRRVTFLSQTQEHHLRIFERHAALVEGGGDVIEHKVGHGDVDLARQLNEAGAEVELARPPEEIKWSIGMH